MVREDRSPTFRALSQNCSASTSLSAPHGSRFTYFLLPSVLPRSSEARIDILADQIAQVSADTTLSDALASESAVRTALADAQRRLEGYEKILGPDSSVGEDLARMAKQLAEKQEALRVMDLKVKENEAVSLPSPFLPGEEANASREES